MPDHADPSTLRSARPSSPFATVEEAIGEVRAGRFVVVLDDADRENEGDLMIAAAFAGPAAINYMATHARGLVSLALTGARCDALGLRLLGDRTGRPHAAAFTVSIEARAGISTGISAHDRAHTIAVAVDEAATAADLTRPGHVLPLRAADGGVLERAGHTEAAVDLARLAGVGPAAVICSIANDDGTMASAADLPRWCAEHGVRLVTTADLIAYRRRTESLAERAGGTRLPTRFGDFEAIGFREHRSGAEHLALVRGELGDGDDVLVHLHAKCLVGDVFGARAGTCDCRTQLDRAIARIEAEGRGVLVYLGGEGCCSAGAVDGEHVGASILRDLGVSGVRLVSGDPMQAGRLRALGLVVRPAHVAVAA